MSEKPRYPFSLFVMMIGSAGYLLGQATAAEKVYPTGYTDTPLIPGTEWRVHDDNRPRPEVVEPGVTDDAPPADAIVLFDGKDLSNWRAKDGGEPGWKVENGYVEIVPKSGDIYTKEEFGDCQLHIEWRTYSPPESNSQHRSNSGIFFFDRYEVQVLDCFNNKTYADGHAGAIYGQYPPLVNVSRKPGEWQSYDIIFEAPRFDDAGELLSPARVTVFHNGVLVQHARELMGATSHKKVAKYKPHGPAGTIRLQDHKDQALRYRNIWIRRLDGKLK